MDVIERCPCPFRHQPVPQVIVGGVIPYRQVLFKVFVYIEDGLPVLCLLDAVAVGFKALLVSQPQVSVLRTVTAASTRVTIPIMARTVVSCHRCSIPTPLTTMPRTMRR